MQLQVWKTFHTSKNDSWDFRLYILLYTIQYVLLVDLRNKILSFYIASSVHPIGGIEMQDNYIAVQFQRSFHDMGGGRKSAVEFSSFSSSFKLTHTHFLYYESYYSFHIQSIDIWYLNRSSTVYNICLHYLFILWLQITI